MAAPLLIPGASPSLPEADPERPAPLRRLLFFAAPPALLMGLIFWLGTGRASAARTRGLLDFLLDRWLSEEALSILNVAIRKAGHFGGYALLGVLLARALYHMWTPRRAWVAAAALAVTVLWAGVDEVHQSFSPSRGAAVEDVILDSVGAACAIPVYLLWKRRKQPAPPQS
jgi:VanZ family protein